MDERERLNKLGLDLSAVTNWEGRPKRARKPPPISYWDEYVATDDWYLRELTADVPVEEWNAAVADEDWGASSGGEEDDEIVETEEEDPDYSEHGGEEEDGTDTTDTGSWADDVVEVDLAASDVSTGGDDVAPDSPDDITARFGTPPPAPPPAPPSTPPRERQ